jgi:hypothetical protein
MSRKINYINGVTIAIARRLVQFVFGEQVLQVTLNHNQAQFEVLLAEQKDEEAAEQSGNIDIFTAYWNGFKFFVIPSKE